MDQLALVCERVASRAGKLDKIRVLAEYFRQLSDSDLALAIQFLSTGPIAPLAGNQNLFAAEERVRLSIGHSVLRRALQQATGWDWDTLNVCYSEVGDSGETAALLLDPVSAKEPLTLAGAEALYRELFLAGTTSRKREVLVAAYQRHRPLTIKYFIKCITRALRIGLMGRMVEEAVAAACNVPNDVVRAANNRLGDLPRVALAARGGELAAIEARLFHPMELMLAKPLERLEDLPDPSAWIVEDKYDGIRSQIHFHSGQVRIYSRGMEDVTTPFPEIAKAFELLPGSDVIDGEILGFRDGRALNFNLLQQRISRRRVVPALMAEVPVAFIAYDVLFHQGRLLLELPLEERRDLLEEVLHGAPFPVLLSAQHEISSTDEIEKLFSDARSRGNEGLLLKRKGSFYEPGKRTGAWYKVKRPIATLDVVITSAEQGSGRRATVLSDYTFAVRSGDGFVNVGKAYSGLTDAEVRELTRILRRISIDRFGSVTLVRPEIVLEVAFDGVQKSSRHKGGFALRFPRILRWRRDKKPEESDDLARVEALFQASLR